MYRIAARSAALLGLYFAGALLGQTSRRPLVIDESRYRVVAGERISIEAPAETVTFMRSARTRIARASNRTFPVAPNVSGDQVLLGIPLTTEPGDYAVSVSFVNGAGEERSTTLQVTVEPFASPAAGSTVPPVVLLDGWQPPGKTACPMANDSTVTFGNLASYLYGSPNFSSAVYFFENCTECPNCTIEQLGADLSTFLNSSPLAAVPQVDVVAHSMGGLIVRSYLSGKQQASGAFSPPATPKIRKSVFIGTPHFGSFQADSVLADIVFGLGNQTNEMKRGSQFIWDLATWNQYGDDLRGTDALAVIGNAGSFEELSNASDGVVALTSGSLEFAEPGRTRIVGYCHVPTNSGLEEAVEAGYLGCTGPGIAYIDSPSHPTYQIVSSFLADSGSWQSVGAAIAQNQYLSKYGGMVVADLNSNDLPVSPSSVSWGGVALTTGAAGHLYYNDMVNGTGSFAFGSSTCGPYTQPIGVYSAVRCKFAPAVYSVGPMLSLPGKVVQTGSTITITGVGFGAQQCGSCRVTASNPQSTVLQISSWSDTSIRAFLPASFVGIATISVATASGSDAINIMASLVSSIAVAPTSLQFAYTVGGTAPASQSIQITSSGGTLTWSAITNVPWLSVAPASGTAPSTVSVLVSPAGVGAGIYMGSVQISAAGASNSPVLINVTLTVTPAQASLAVSPQALTFSYTVGGTVPAAQGVPITNTGGGTLSWSASASAAWVGLSPVSGAAPATMSVSVNPAGLLAGTYSATVRISATGATGSPASVSVTLVVQAPQPTVNITAVDNGASFQAGFASATWVSIFGTNLSQATRTWQDSDFVNGLLPTSLNGVSVTINGLPAYVEYISPTQVNVLAPDDATVGAVQVQMTTAQGKSNSFTAQKQQFAPAFFWMAGGPYVAAQHADYTYVGKPGLIAGVTTQPAKPGEMILLYGTGFGPTSPPLPSAQLVTTPAHLANSVQVTIGGVDAPVAYAGLVEAGLYQFNVTVPSVPSGDAAVVARIGGVQTQTGVSITIQ